MAHAARSHVARSTAEPLAYDPFDPGVIDGPYPWYRLVREAPVFYAERHDLWVLSGYDDVRAAARDHARLSSAEGVALQRAGHR